MKNVGVKVENRSVSKTIHQQPIKKKPIKER
jgi:hypothetical protein